LAEAVRRLLRRPGGGVALVLRLSGLQPPAPRPHHRRIARALMQDAAQRHDGQVFVLRNGDLVLLCRVPPEAVPEAALDNLPATLARLLRVDTPHPDRLVSLWPLASGPAALVQYVADRAREAVPIDPRAASPAGASPRPPPAKLGSASVAELLRRQVAVVLPYRGAAARPVAAGLRPIYREIGLSLPAMEARLGGLAEAPSAGIDAGHPGGDPFLLRHLAGRLDPLLFDALHRALGSGSPLDAAAASGLPLHVALNLPAIASDAFLVWSEACRARDVSCGVEVAMAEACADAAGFLAARARVRAAGMTLMLSGVSHLTLLLTRPWALGVDLLKLDWSPRLLDLVVADAEAVAAAVAGQGAARVVLARADTEAALRWGMARGIRRFQGRHVDAMLAAARIVECAHAGGCTLPQCIARAAAVEPEGRRFCRDIRLLDAGAPAEARQNEDRQSESFQPSSPPMIATT